MNLGSETYTIKRGDRLAQMVLAKVERAVFKIADELSDTDRGTGELGSTGV